MKAMILAAGRGERLRPLTDHLPKPLLMAGEEPLIGWHLRRLARAGFTDIVINHAWLGEKLEQALGSGQDYGVHITWSRERVALETAGGIAYALPLLGGAPFVVVNGDILCDFDFARLTALVTQLDAKQHLAHLVLVHNPPHHPQGDFYLSQTGWVSETADLGLRLTFSGIALYHPAFFAAVCAQSSPRVQALRPLLTQAMAQQQISGEYFNGLWLDVGSVERLDEAQRLAQSWDAI